MGRTKTAASKTELPSPKKKARGRKSIAGKFDDARKEQFLTLYAAGGTVASCARKVGVSRITVFAHVRSSTEFAERYRMAMELNTDAIEDSLHMLACGGNITAIFGMLRARRPQVWRENVNVTGNVEHSFAGDFAAAMARMTGNGNGAAATPSVH